METMGVQFKLLACKTLEELLEVQKMCPHRINFMIYSVVDGQKCFLNVDLDNE